MGVSKVGLIIRGSLWVVSLSARMARAKEGSEQSEHVAFRLEVLVEEGR